METVFGIESGPFRNIVETIYYLVYILGIPIVALEALRKQRQRLNLEREKVYIEVNDKYIEFLSLSLQYPRLGVTEFSDESPDLTPGEIIQQRILYDMLTSIFERTFFLYKVDGKEKSSEWRSWDLWISKFIDKDSYKKYISIYALYGCFGENFQNYLKHKIEGR